jgi:hypothetical protein
MPSIGTRNSSLELAARTEWQRNGLKCERIDLLHPDKVLEGRVFVPIIGRRHPLLSQYNRASHLNIIRRDWNEGKGVEVDQRFGFENNLGRHPSLSGRRDDDQRDSVDHIGFIHRPYLLDFFHLDISVHLWMWSSCDVEVRTRQSGPVLEFPIARSSSDHGGRRHASV